MSTVVVNLPKATSGASGGGDASAANQVASNNLLTVIKNRTPGSLLGNIDYDDIQVTFPTDETEVYSYYLATVLKASIELTYDNATKDNLIRARKL